MKPKAKKPAVKKTTKRGNKIARQIKALAKRKPTPKPNAEPVALIICDLALDTVIQYTREQKRGMEVFKMRNIGKTRGAIVVCVTGQREIELMTAALDYINAQLDADLGL